MATGDNNDMVSRLRALIPNGWFNDVAPVRDAVLGGISDILAFGYSLISYAKLQTRILTATGPWLDLIALDFFGAALRRNVGQSDSSFQARIISSLFRERVTRSGMIATLTDLTGKAPLIFEPWNTGDTGGIGIAFGIGGGGGIGSVSLPAQVFITAFRPGTAGVPNVAGIGFGGIGAGISSIINPANALGVTDADIYATIAQTLPTGVIGWTQLH